MLKAWEDRAAEEKPIMIILGKQFSLEKTVEESH